MKGDRDIVQQIPAQENSTGTRSRRHPFLNIALALVLTPAVLACGRPPSSAGSIDRSSPAVSKNTGRVSPDIDPETEELVRMGKQIIQQRKDCIVIDLSEEMVDLRRGVPTYVERPVRDDDPSRAMILGFRAANTDILRESADRVKNDNPVRQVIGLQTTYLALAKTDMQLSKELSGSAKADLVDAAKCWVVKYISLAVILDDLRNQDKERNNRRRVSWAPGTEV